MITIKDIARRANVSVGTVDRVLHGRGTVKEETRARVMAVVEEAGYRPNLAAQGLAVRKRKLRLGFVYPDPVKNPFFEDVRRAAQRKADELAQYGVQVLFYKVTVVDGAGGRKDVALPEASAPAASPLPPLAELDGAVLPGMMTERVEQWMRLLHGQGKPVVCYNVAPPEGDFLAYVGCDYEKAGRLAAGLCALIGGPDSAVCIYSQGIGQDIASYTGRVRGFAQEAARRYPEMRILDYREIGDNQVDNYISAQEMLARFPQVNMVYVVNPADYGICEAICRADRERRVQIVTNDVTPAQAQMMQEGMIAATVCQEPERQGTRSLELLFRYLAFGEKPARRDCFTALTIDIAQSLS